MSLLPLFTNENWDYMRPSRVLDQHFGLGLDHTNLFAPLNVHPFNSINRSQPSYYRPWWFSAASGDVGSTIAASKEKYQVTLDVQHFAPEEITVKVTGGNRITVEGKHEEKQDDHGFISRHFVRRYVLPDGHDIKNVVSNLSSDGVLSITAPRVDKSIDEHRTIPIQQTGAPLKTLGKKPEAKE